MSTLQDVARTWFQRVWTEEDASAIDELFVPDGEARGLGGNTLIGPEGFRGFHTALCAHLTSFEFTLDRCMEEGDWLFALCTMRAVSRRSGEPVTMTGTALIRIRDGKLLEAYNHFDFMGLFAQLGLMPADEFERCLAGDPPAPERPDDY